MFNESKRTQDSYPLLNRPYPIESKTQLPLSFFQPTEEGIVDG